MKGLISRFQRYFWNTDITGAYNHRFYYTLESSSTGITILLLSLFSRFVRFLFTKVTQVFLSINHQRFSNINFVTQS